MTLFLIREEWFTFFFFRSSKSHAHLSPLTLFRRIHPMPHVILCKILWCGLSTHHPTCELEDHPLPVAHYYAFNSFTAIRPLSMCHPIMCHGVMIILILNTEWAETFKKILFLVDVEGGFQEHALPVAVYEQVPTMLYAFFWVTPWRLNFICRRFGTLCLFRLHRWINPLNPELNPICYLLALLAHHFLHVSRIRVKSLTHWHTQTSLRRPDSLAPLIQSRLWDAIQRPTQHHSTTGVCIEVNKN